MRKTHAITKHGHHGGTMTPRAPKAAVPMQEFTMYVVVDAQGDADRATISTRKHDVPRRYIGEDLPLSKERQRAVLRQIREDGARIARVAVAEDA